VDQSLDPFATVTADADYIYFPGMPPRRRKHAHKWRDATKEEMETQAAMGVQIREGEDDADFYEEFMENAKREYLCNLNPTILNAL